MTPLELARIMVPGVSQDILSHNLPLIVDALKEFDILDRDMFLMAVATVATEVPNFEPIDEYISRYNDSGGPADYDKYNNRSDLGNDPGEGDGARYHGRGYIQLTGEDNYEFFAKVLDEPINLAPELANHPRVAARILAAFLRRAEPQIRVAIVEGNLAEARRLVNGGRHGLDRFTSVFRRGDRESPKSWKP